jgi:hypothetical protein
MRDPRLLEDERAPREAEAGLWALPEAQRVPPWEWRQGGVTREPPARAVQPAPHTGFTCGSERYCREMAAGV